MQTLQGPDTFAVHEPPSGQSSIEARGGAWIDEPPDRAAYLVLLTTDALRAQTTRARGLPIVGFSPEGLVDLSQRSLSFVTPPVRFRIAARATDPGTPTRLTLHDDLLVVDDRGLQFAERRDARFMPVASIPFERIVSVRWDDGLLARERLWVHWRDGERARTSRFTLVREPDLGCDALRPLLPMIAARTPPAWHREPVGLRVEDTVPEIVFREAPTASASRLLDDAMLGGTITAGVCGLCCGGTCPPQMLASCAGLFAVGAAMGTVMGIGREWASGERDAPAPTRSPQQAAADAARLGAGARSALSPAALTGCLRALPAAEAPRGSAGAQSGAGRTDPVGAGGTYPVGAGRTDPVRAGRMDPALPSPWWVEQGRAAYLVEDRAMPGFLLTVALSRIELVGQPMRADAKAPDQRPAHLSIGARVTVMPAGAPEPALATEVLWNSDDAPLAQWSAADDPVLGAALRTACVELARTIRDQAARGWRASMPSLDRQL